eukprot:3824325-Prymnesium_polylepis.1
MPSRESASRVRAGAFITSCYSHCGFDSEDWSEAKLLPLTADIDRRGLATLQRAFDKWWHDDSGAGGQSHTYLPCELHSQPPYQCNPTCPLRYSQWDTPGTPRAWQLLPPAGAAAFLLVAAVSAWARWWWRARPRWGAAKELGAVTEGVEQECHSTSTQETTLPLVDAARRNDHSCSTPESTESL